MDPSSQEHQHLLRLLALKRHEVPPPGFFDRLPNRILVNIRAGSEVVDMPWWKRAWETLLREPMIASSYAALTMGALLFGVSVFQTATVPDGTPALALQDASVPDPVGLIPSTASLPGGTIYRTTLSPATLWQDDGSLGTQPVLEPVRLQSPRYHGGPAVPGTLLGNLNR